MVGARPRCEVVRGESGGLGAPGIHDPHLRPVPQRPERVHRIGHGDRVSVGHDRVAADVHHEPGPVVVGPGVEGDRPADQVGHEDLGGAVDGQRAEPRGGADGAVQRLGHAVPGRVHAHAAAEEDADRGRAVAIDDGAQPGAEVVQARLPRRRAEAAVDPHQRPFEPLGVVVHRRQRPSLGAGVAVREGVVAIAPDPDDPVALDVDEDPAHRGADPAEAPDGADLPRRHPADTASSAAPGPGTSASSAAATISSASARSRNPPATAPSAASVTAST